MWALTPTAFVCSGHQCHATLPCLPEKQSVFFSLDKGQPRTKHCSQQSVATSRTYKGNLLCLFSQGETWTLIFTFSRLLPYLDTTKKPQPTGTKTREKIEDTTQWLHNSNNWSTAWHLREGKLKKVCILLHSKSSCWLTRALNCLPKCRKHRCIGDFLS